MSIKSKKCMDCKAVVYMRCAEMFYDGAGIELEHFLSAAALHGKDIIDLAKRENIRDFIIDAVKSLTKKESKA